VNNLKTFKTQGNAEEMLKGNLHRSDKPYPSEMFLHRKPHLCYPVLAVPTTSSAHTQLRLCKTENITKILRGFQELSQTQQLLCGEEEPEPKRKATTLMKSHIHKDLWCS